MRKQLLGHSASLPSILLLLCLGCGQPNTGAQPPFGVFDHPQENSSFRGIAFAMGWALAEGGIARVDLYLDGKFLQKAVLKVQRPDVLNLYPAFRSAEGPGWVTELHTESLPIGKHQFLVRLTSKRGAVTDLGPHTVEIKH